MQVTTSGVEDGGDGLREGSNPCESQVSGLDRESSSQEMRKPCSLKGSGKAGGSGA